jgi:hypothetical protein
MNLVLDLPTELESELAAEAAQLGLSLSDYALRILATGRPGLSAPKTGADLVDYWKREGLIGSRSDITDAARCGTRSGDSCGQPPGN